MPISQIVTNSIASGAVVADDLANSSVTTAKIADSAITTAKIASGAVVQAALATAVIPLGVGQVWTDVTSSRSLGVTYTNSTGRPIFFMVSITQNNSGIGTNGDIAGVQFNAHQDNGSSSTGSFVGIVPNGGTYGNIRTEPGKSINLWMELR